MKNAVLIVFITVGLLCRPTDTGAQTTSNPNWTNVVKWSPDGNLIAVATENGSIQILDSGGDLISQLQTNTWAVYTLAWNSDSTRLASAGMEGIKIWDVSRDI